MQLATYVTQMVSLIGLGIAIDYSLLVVYRYREERERADEGGRDRADDEHRRPRGGLQRHAVAIGLALMLAMPLPFMRGFGLAGLLIPRCR
jgi:RND superfamily putative drug exporter